MRNLLLLICIMWSTVAMAQYRPKPGETVLKVEIEGRGDVYIRLYTKEAPRTTAHVLKLVQRSFYSGQRFHRVERSPRPYLVQVGDPASKSGDLNDPAMGSGGSGTRVAYEENSLKHEVGSVGLARSPEDKDSGDSQFYITLAPARFLDGKYTVFGQVVSGLEILQRIERGDRVLSVSVVQ